MSFRQSGSDSKTRLSSSAPRAALRRVRMFTRGNWHHPIDAPPVVERSPRLIAIGSPRAAAGKSIVAANLGVAIAGLGARVTLVDLDPRTPRQHALFGVRSRAGNLAAWLRQRREERDEVPELTGVRNLRILPAMGASPLDGDQRRALVDQLHAMSDVADVVVVDLGHDNRDDLLDLFATRALRVLVSSREPAALEAAYAFLAGAAARAARRYGAGARAALAQFSGGLIGNSTAGPEDTESLHAFSRLVREHLGIALPVIGCVRQSARVERSIEARKPLLAGRGIDDNVRSFQHMAELLMTDAGLATGTCALDGSPILVAPGPLPAALSSYERKHPRFAVDWAATLELPEGRSEVRVLDASETGVAIQTSIRLLRGDAGVLHFDQLAGQPPLAVVVKNVFPAMRRVGLAFVRGGDGAARLADTARRLTAAAP